MTHTLTITVPKRTGTYADILEAVGTASLIEELYYSPVNLKDAGSSFEITGLNGPHPDDWPDITPGYRYVWKQSAEQLTPPQLPLVLDYLQQKEQNEVWKKFNEGAKKKSKVAQAAVELDVPLPERPGPDYFVAAILESMRKGWNGDRDLANWIAAYPDISLQWVRSEFCGLLKPAQLPTITNSQVFNPIGGKGLHNAKTALVAPGSLPDTLIRPFAEWMKFRGLWQSMLLMRSGDDFKFFVLQPSHISLTSYRVIHQSLRSMNLWGGVRLDIWATFETLRTFLKHSFAAESVAPPWGRRPRAVLDSLRLAFFKSLGTAAALMNESSFPIPDWFSIETQDDVSAYLKIIAESIGVSDRFGGCLGTLDESHSDDGRTLQQYRDWLLSGELTDLLAFHSHFATHVMALRAANKYTVEFTTPTLDLLFGRAFPQELAMQEIIHDEGFLSVARSVRDATIYAELKNRPVSFGLAQNWKQKLKSGDAEFLAAVAEFIQEQNWLTQNRFNGRGHVVLTTHLDQLVSLIERFGAELVGSLLLAYGYARTPKTTPSEEPKDSDQ